MPSWKSSISRTELPAINSPSLRMTICVPCVSSSAIRQMRGNLDVVAQAMPLTSSDFLLSNRYPSVCRGACRLPSRACRPERTPGSHLSKPPRTWNTLSEWRPGDGRGHYAQSSLRFPFVEIVTSRESDSPGRTGTGVGMRTRPEVSQQGAARLTVFGIRATYPSVRRIRPHSGPRRRWPTPNAGAAPSVTCEAEAEPFHAWAVGAACVWYTLHRHQQEARATCPRPAVRCIWASSSSAPATTWPAGAPKAPSTTTWNCR